MESGVEFAAVASSRRRRLAGIHYYWR